MMSRQIFSNYTMERLDFQWNRNGFFRNIFGRIDECFTRKSLYAIFKRVCERIRADKNGVLIC
jgi:hypothetical protein